MVSVLPNRSIPPLHWCRWTSNNKRSLSYPAELPYRPPPWCPSSPPRHDLCMARTIQPPTSPDGSSAPEGILPGNTGCHLHTPFRRCPLTHPLARHGSDLRCPLRLWGITALRGIVGALATSAAAVSCRTVLRHYATVTTIEEGPSGPNRRPSEGVETRARGVGA